MRALPRRLALCIAACLTAALAYRTPIAPDSELDGSWRYVLATASARHFVFGRDLIYTYGPLGWLGAPLRTDDHAVVLPLMLATIAIACGLATARLVAISNEWPRATIAFVLACGAFAWHGSARAQGIPTDYQLVFVALIALATVGPRSAFAPWIYLGVGSCAGLLIAVKIFAAVTVGLACSVGIGIIAFEHPRRALRFGLLALAGFLGIAVLTVLDPLRHGALGSYVLDSIDVAGGYAAAMSTPGTPGETRMALGAIAAGLVLILICAREGRRRLAAVCGIVLLLGWKHATIREGLDHAPYLYATLALIAAIAIASGIGRNASIGAALVGTVALVHLGTLYAVTHRTPLPTLADGTIAAPSRDWAGHTLDALPNDAVTAMLSGGVYQPLPMFQLFSAYTPHLDALDARALQTHGAEIILYRFTSIDNRYPFADAPLVMSGLLCDYQEVGETRSVDGRPFIELQRSRNRCSEHVLANVSRPGERVLLPRVARSDFVTARITLESTTLGRAQALFWRVPLPTLAFSFTNGDVRRSKIVAATARDGIVVDPAPTDQADARAIFAGEQTANVSSFAVDPGPGYRVTSITLTLVHRTHGA